MWQKIKENAPSLHQKFASADPRGIPLRDVDGFKVPEWWSDNAAMICRTRYANEQLGETSAIEICERMASGWAHAAVRDGYIKDGDAGEFVNLYANIMLHQLAAPNSPQWFNTGVHLAGGRMKSSGNWVYRPEGAFQPEDALEYPQVHACFINGVEDQLVGDGSIDDLWSRETRIFKHGSGSGANFSSVRERGAPLSGGGTSSGVMSFLSVGDTNAGAIKSGGTTRRAALMRTLNVDHPDIIDFIRWKSREEAKVAYLAEGSKVVSALASGESVEGVDPAIADRVKRMGEEGILDGYFSEMDTGWTSEAYSTVDGQNSNNSVMVPDAFMEAVKSDGEWQLTSRVDGSVVRTVRAREIWREIAESAWLSADPAVQFYDTINRYNTAKSSGQIVSTNPCSEYLYLNDTACNLASINLAAARRFCIDPVTGELWELEYAIVSQLAYAMTVILDITINMASYPSKRIAELTYKHRTLGLGFTGLGEYLAIKGEAYESSRGRSIAEVVSVYIWEAAYSATIDMGDALGPCEAWYDNEDDVRVVYADKMGFDPSMVKPVRNMQLTCIAPTGTISFVMDAGSTGIEPPYALQTRKSLAGGGHMDVSLPFVDEAIRAVAGSDYEIAEYMNSVDSGEIPDALKGVLATANTVSWKGHVDMMAAVQPFVCGAISKTVNMPESSSVQDVMDVYEYAFDSGIKCIALYRDKSKLSAPLSEVTSDDGSNSVEGSATDYAGNGHVAGQRKPLPAKRKGYTQKVNIDSQSLYIRTGEYEDGSLGELFLDMGKEGGAYGGLLSAFAKAVSIGLQYGVPLEVFADSFIGTRMQPSGFVFGHDDIKMCTSPIDLIFKDLELSYGSVDRDYSVDAGDNGGSGSVIPEKNVGNEYTGDVCVSCEGVRLVRTGSCSTCLDCGATTGCA